MANIVKRAGHPVFKSWFWAFLTANAFRRSGKGPVRAKKTEMDQTTLKKAISSLKDALKKDFTAMTVLFDSWFCFNSFIVKIVGKLGVNMICQLKNPPKPNKYTYKGKEQVSNLDSMIASDALVFMRYAALTHLASKEKVRFHDKFDTLRIKQKMRCFGMRLLKFF